jgi:hypothetical protein
MRTAQPRLAIPRITTLALAALMVFTLASAGSGPRVASADAPDTIVTDWNLHAVNAFANGGAATPPGAGQAPQVAILHIAMAQGAVHDAVTSIAGGFQPYSSGLPAAPVTASKAAAVATAAHRVMTEVVIVPPMPAATEAWLDARLAESIADATATDGAGAVADGIDAGEAAADAMLLARASDGRFVPFALTIGTEPGEWRPTPPAFVPDPNAWVGNVEPFTLTSTSQFRSKGPHALNTGIYAKEYNEVKTLGGGPGFNSRTPEQEALAVFFAVNPVEMYNRAFRTVAADKSLTIAEQSRLFAMLNIAGADALINCSNDKIHWSFWRPITAIQNGDDDGNRKTAGDATWTSMFPSPPYSDHTSGYNCVTGAFMHTAEAFFGHGRAGFTLVRVAPNVPDIAREYDRYSDVIDDTIDARIYQGLHFRAADVQGAKIGKDVSDWLTGHYFKPVK